MTTKTMRNFVKVMNYGKPFYASDLKLNGGEVSALQYYNLIRPTGNERQIDLGFGYDYVKTVFVAEWVVNDKTSKLQKELELTIARLESEIAEARELLDILDSIE